MSQKSFIPLDNSIQIRKTLINLFANCHNHWWLMHFSQCPVFAHCKTKRYLPIVKQNGVKHQNHFFTTLFSLLIEFSSQSPKRIYRTSKGSFTRMKGQTSTKFSKIPPNNIKGFKETESKCRKTNIYNYVNWKVRCPLTPPLVVV